MGDAFGFLPTGTLLETSHTRCGGGGICSGSCRGACKGSCKGSCGGHAEDVALPSMAPLAGDDVDRSEIEHFSRGGGFDVGQFVAASTEWSEALESTLWMESGAESIFEAGVFPIGELQLSRELRSQASGGGWEPRPGFSTGTSIDWYRTWAATSIDGDGETAKDCGIRVSCAAIKQLLGIHPQAWERANKGMPIGPINKNRRQILHCWIEVRHCGEEEWNRYEIDYPEWPDEKIAQVNEARKAGNFPQITKLGKHLYKNLHLPGDDIGAGWKQDIYWQTIRCDGEAAPENEIMCDCISDETVKGYVFKDQYHFPFWSHGRNSNTFAQALMNYCKIGQTRDRRSIKLPGGFDTPGSGLATDEGHEFDSERWHSGAYLRREFR